MKLLTFNFGYDLVKIYWTIHEGPGGVIFKVVFQFEIFKVVFHFDIFEVVIHFKKIEVVFHLEILEVVLYLVGLK